jgi:protein-disulfide isomerase
VLRWLLGVMLVLSACSAAPAAAPPADGLPVRLPTVTPAGPAAVRPSPQVIVLPTAAPTGLPTATATAEVTAAGVRTASMVQLGLAAESYNTVGDPAAPITVVEFSDHGCTFCRRHHLLNWPELKRRYIDSGLVFYVYKDLPVSSRQGARAAAAVGCAAEQSLAAALRDVLFTAPERWNVADAAVDGALAGLVTELGGDGAALRACLQDGRYLAGIDSDVREAERLRLFGTPYFFINGRLLAGSLPLEQWVTLLETELAGGDVQ